ncbi:MAG: glycosyltransferase family 4 protein, partial [bacterium]|nr:glycosyltransferase family 4 protein [bacterium]
MPRILFVTRYHVSWITGGAEEQCWLLSCELARRGWDVHYAAEMGPTPPPRRSDGMTLHPLPDRPRWWKNNRRAVRALMRELDPDVVFQLGFDHYTGYAMLDAPRRAVRVWATSFDWDGLIWPILRQRLKMTGLLHFPWWLVVYLPGLLLAHRGSRAADLVLVPKRDKQEQLLRKGLRSQIFGNALPSIPASDVQTHEGRPRALWAASVKQWKQPEKFIELASRCRDLDAEFVMIGSIQEDGYREIVANAVRDLPNFRYEGFVPLTQVRDAFRQSHVFVNTSVSEGFGTSLIHAWQHGVPVATLGVNPDRLITDRQLGIVAETMDELVGGLRD